MAEPNGYRQAFLPATDPESCDGRALAAIEAGRIRVHVEAGEIYTADDDERAERLDRHTGYGRVYVGGSRSAMAHRVVWLAAYGFIPPELEVNHLNRKRWDNRLSNLELVTPKGNSAHWRGEDYPSLAAGFTVDEILSRVRQACESDDAPSPLTTNFLQRVGGRWVSPPAPQRGDWPIRD